MANGHPHLFRRGQTLHWRRRLKRLSTGFVDIMLSLHTADPRLAVILARKLSAESDVVMTHAAQNLMTDAEARQWLSAVIARERDKIANLNLMRRVDSTAPDDDLRHDRAMRSAWMHISANGINAPAVENADELELANVDMLRRDLTSDARRRIILREFRDLIGRDVRSARETLAVLDMYVQGKHEAWNTTVGESSAAAPMKSAEIAPVHHEPPLVDRRANDEEIFEPAPDTSPFDPDMAAVVSRMNALKRSEGIEEKTLHQYESFASLFTRLTGVTDVCLIRQSHASAFRADLYKLPKSWGKSPKDATATRDEIMARASSLSPDKVGLSVGTINRHLEHLNQIIGWASDEGIAVDPKLKPAKLRRKETTRSRDKRDAFTENDIRRFFQHEIWKEPDQTCDGNFWGPVLGAYTGARRGEIAGLAVSDIVEIEGVPCIHIRHNALRRIKSMSSDRILPIHSHLIDLGLLQHVQTMRAKGSAALFPDQREARSVIWGRRLGRLMRDAIDEQLGEDGASLSFHSFRHYVQNALDRKGVDDKVVRDVIGHEGKDEHERTYRKQSLMVEMKAAVENLPRVF
jgi:integrase